MRNAAFAATLAAVLSVGGAAYADGLPSKSKASKYVEPEPISAPVTSWTGFYIGGGVGAGSVKHDLDLSVRGESLFGLNGIGGDGVFGTVQGGFDKQLGKIVVGVFADYDFSNFRSSASLLGNSIQIEVEDQWSVGGRIGLLVNPNTLIYALAAYTEVKFDFGRLPVKEDEFSGYSVGGGLETNLGGNWFLKGEYRYTELDKEALFAAGGRYDGYETLERGGSSVKLNDEATLHTARVVLTYKFGAGSSEYIPLK